MNFYPRSPCGERRRSKTHDRHKTRISIHALLAESDVKLLLQLMKVPLFLSTLSLRRATPPRVAALFGRCYFYPRSPCGERHRIHRQFPRQTQISIHALLAESDPPRGDSCYLDNIISIHALLAESDPLPTGHLSLPRYFYPRSPCGERLDIRDNAL